MPETTSPKVELTCLQGLADLERIEGSFLYALTAGDPEGAAVMLRLLLAHIASTSKRVILAMVLDRVDADDLGLQADKSARTAKCCRRLKQVCKRVGALLSLFRQTLLAADCRHLRVRAEIQSLTRKPLQ